LALKEFEPTLLQSQPHQSRMKTKSVESTAKTPKSIKAGDSIRGLRSALQTVLLVILQNFKCH